MNKKTVLSLLLDFIFLAVFNTVFYVAGGTDHQASVWLSYGFIHFSYLMIIATPFLIRKSSSSAIFGFSISTISSTYFFVEFIVGLLFIFLKLKSIKAALIVQVIIAGIYAVMLITHLLANEYTADSIERHEAEVAYIKEASASVRLLMGKTDSKKANRKIEKAYDALHSSPSKSNASVKTIERTILEKVNELKASINTEDENAIIARADEIISLVDERNAGLRY